VTCQCTGAPALCSESCLGCPPYVDLSDLSAAQQAVCASAPRDQCVPQCSAYKDCPCESAPALCLDSCRGCPPYVDPTELDAAQQAFCAASPRDRCVAECGVFRRCPRAPPPVLEPSSCPATSRSPLQEFPRRYRNKEWCNTNCKPAIRKDPHLYLPHGGRADFRGQHDTIFNLLSAKNVSFNVRMEEADFNWAKRLVHGTKMAAAYWTIRTYRGNTLMVEYSAKAGETSAQVTEKDRRTVIVKDGQPPLSVDNVWIQLVGKALTVATDKWSFKAEKSAFPFARLDTNKNKVLLDVSISPLYNADSDVVAPHGIIGQAYDGDALAVDGRIDTDRSAESTTKAQAEGAIEGDWKDYIMASGFRTDFKFSRFDAKAAKPRDVSKLTGGKHALGSSPVRVGASDSEPTVQTA